MALTNGEFVLAITATNLHPEMMPRIASLLCDTCFMQPGVLYEISTTANVSARKPAESGINGRNGPNARRCSMITGFAFQTQNRNTRKQKTVVTIGAAGTHTSAYKPVTPACGQSDIPNDARALAQVAPDFQRPDETSARKQIGPRVRHATSGP